MHLLCIDAIAFEDTYWPFVDDVMEIWKNAAVSLLKKKLCLGLRAAAFTTTFVLFIINSPNRTLTNFLAKSSAYRYSFFRRLFSNSFTDIG